MANRTNNRNNPEGRNQFVDMRRECKDRECDVRWSRSGEARWRDGVTKWADAYVCEKCKTRLDDGNGDDAA